MSKEFKEALEALRAAGDALLVLSDVIEKVLTEAASKGTPAEDAPAESSVTMADVKAMLTKKSRAGKKHLCSPLSGGSKPLSSPEISQHFPSHSALIFFQNRVFPTDVMLLQAAVYTS